MDWVNLPLNKAKVECNSLSNLARRNRCRSWPLVDSWRWPMLNQGKLSKKIYSRRSFSTLLCKYWLVWKSKRTMRSSLDASTSCRKLCARWAITLRSTLLSHCPSRKYRMKSATLSKPCCKRLPKRVRRKSKKTNQLTSWLSLFTRPWKRPVVWKLACKALWTLRSLLTASRWQARSKGRVI